VKTTSVRGASRRTIILFVVLISLLLAGTAWAAGGSTQPNPLEDAQQRAAAFGSYTFTADVEQRLIPHPTAANIGEPDQRLDLRLEGEVTLPDHARMVMRFEGAGADSPEIELIREGHEVYLLQDGALTPMDDPAGFRRLSELSQRRRERDHLPRRRRPRPQLLRL